MGPVAQRVFKTRAVVQPTARSVRLRRRSVVGPSAAVGLAAVAFREDATASGDRCLPGEASVVPSGAAYEQDESHDAGNQQGDDEPRHLLNIDPLAAVASPSWFREPAGSRAQRLRLRRSRRSRNGDRSSTARRHPARSSRAARWRPADGALGRRRDRAHAFRNPGPDVRPLDSAQYRPELMRLADNWRRCCRKRGAARAILARTSCAPWPRSSRRSGS